MQVCQPLGGKKSASATAAWATLEARASGRWAHPNIVRAIKHCTVLTPGVCPFSSPMCQIYHVGFSMSSCSLQPDRT